MRIRKGIYYFPTYQEARTYAEQNGWPTNRIIPYQIGWAIQLRVSGPYVGPATGACRVSVAPSASTPLDTATEKTMTDKNVGIQNYTGLVRRERSKKVATADGRGWTSVPNGAEISTILLTIDVDAVMRQIGGKALRNKNGRAIGLGGLIKAKAISRRET